MRHLTIKMYGYCFYGFRKCSEGFIGMPTHRPEADAE